MANRYSQNFTLADIFNNPDFKGKVPMINYKEQEREEGKISRRTNTASIGRLIYDTSVSAARPFYKPLTPSKQGNTIILSGKLEGDHNSAVEAVYSAIMANKGLLGFTANNAEMIRDALKESENNKRFGLNSKLYLKQQSLQGIREMTPRQLSNFLNEVMENIYYGDDFPKTKKAWNATWNPEILTLSTAFGNTFGSYGNLFSDYYQRRIAWKLKVGATL